jgi:hypothetical protein
MALMDRWRGLKAMFAKAKDLNEWREVTKIS